MERNSLYLMENCNLAESPGLEEKNNRKQAWVVMTAGFFLVFILYGSYYCFSVFLKPMTAELGWSRAMTSGALSLYMVVHGIFSIIMGTLSDKYGPHKVVAGSTVLTALGYMLIYFVSAPWHLYLFFGIFVGIGMGAAYVPPCSAVTKWFTARRGLALGIVGAGVGAGQMVIPPLMTWIISIFGWRGAFIIIGIIIIVSGIPAALMLKNPDQNPFDEKQTDSAENDAGSDIIKPVSRDFTVRETVKTLSFALLLYIFIAMIFGVAMVTTHLVAHIQDFNIDPVPAAFAMTLIGAGGMLGRIFLGGVADKTGSRMILSACLGLLVALLLLLLIAGSLWHFYVIAALFGLSYGGMVPVIIKMSSDFFGVKYSGTIYGILIFGATVGGAAGVPLAGYIYDVTGRYSPAFLVAGLILAVAFIISFIIKAPEKAPAFV